MQVMQRRVRGQVLGSLLLIALLIAFGFIVARLFPSYMEFYRVQTALTNLAKIHDVTQKTDDEVRNYLSKQFASQNITAVDVNKDIKIERNNNKISNIEVAFEVKKHIIANADVVLTFKTDTKVE